MDKRKIVIIGIAVAIGLMFLISQISAEINRNETKARISAYLEQQPTITITGVIDHWNPIDGPSFALVTDEKVDAEVGYRGIYLYGKELDEHLEGKHVRIQGKLLKSYVEYAENTGIMYSGGSPTTATIIIEDIQILNS